MSFWGSLLGAAASFIPVVGPAIGAGIGALTGAGGGGNSKQYDPLANPTVQNLLKGLGSPSVEDPATKQAQDYYSTVLHGGEEATRSLLGPDVSTILSQYDQAAKTAAELGPKGGGRTAIEAEAPFQKAGAYGKLLASAKATAGAGLTTIGGQQTAAATARRGQDVSTLSSVLGGSSEQQRLQFEQNQANAKAFGQLGSGIGSTLVNLLNKPKSSSGTPATSAGGDSW